MSSLYHGRQQRWTAPSLFGALLGLQSFVHAQDATSTTIVSMIPCALESSGASSIENTATVSDWCPIVGSVATSSAAGVATSTTYITSTTDPAGSSTYSDNIASYVVGGLTYTASQDPSSSSFAVIDGSITLTAGGSATIIDDQTFSLAPSGVVIDGTTEAWSAPLTSTTDTSTTDTSTTDSAATTTTGAVVGTLATLTAGGITITASQDPSQTSVVVIDGSITLTQGSSDTVVDGQTISFAPGGIVVGSTTEPLTTEPLTTSNTDSVGTLTTFTAAGITITASQDPSQTSVVVIDGSATLTQGGSDTVVDGQTVSYAPGGVVVGTATQPLTLSDTGSSNTGSSNTGSSNTGSSGTLATFTAGGVTITASQDPSQSSVVVIDGSVTLTQGGSDTVVDGQTVSYAASGVVIGGITEPWTPPNTASSASDGQTTSATGATATVTSAPSGFSFSTIVTSTISADEWVTTTNAAGSTTVVPELVGPSGHPIIIWFPIPLPAVVYTFPTFPTLPTFSFPCIPIPFLNNCASPPDSGTAPDSSDPSPSPSPSDTSDPTNTDTATSTATSSTTSSCSSITVTDCVVECSMTTTGTALTGSTTCYSTSCSTVTGCDVTATTTTTEVDACATDAQDSIYSFLSSAAAAVPLATVSGQVGPQYMLGGPDTDSATSSDTDTATSSATGTTTSSTTDSAITSTADTTTSPITTAPVPTCSLQNADPDQGINVAACVCDSTTLPLLTVTSATAASQSCAYTVLPTTSVTNPVTIATSSWTTNCQACTLVGGEAGSETCTTVADCTATTSAPSSTLATTTTTSTPTTTAAPSTTGTLTILEYSVTNLADLRAGAVGFVIGQPTGLFGPCTAVFSNYALATNSNFPSAPAPTSIQFTDYTHSSTTCAYTAVPSTTQMVCAGMTYPCDTDVGTLEWECSAAELAPTTWKQIAYCYMTAAP